LVGVLTTPTNGGNASYFSSVCKLTTSKVPRIIAAPGALSARGTWSKGFEA
jgi:hypothetical protein